MYFFIPLRDSEGGKKPHCNSVISMSSSSLDQECKGILFCECHFLSGLLYFNFLDMKTGREDELGIEMRGYEHDSLLLQNVLFQREKNFCKTEQSAFKTIVINKLFLSFKNFIQENKLSLKKIQSFSVLTVPVYFVFFHLLSQQSDFTS